jgi:hypothetical protein
VFDLCPWKTSLDVKATTSDEVPSCCSSKGVCGLSATASGLIGIGGSEVRSICFQCDFSATRSWSSEEIF